MNNDFTILALVFLIPGLCQAQDEVNPFFDRTRIVEYKPEETNGWGIVEFYKAFPIALVGRPISSLFDLVDGQETEYRVLNLDEKNGYLILGEDGSNTEFEMVLYRQESGEALICTKICDYYETRPNGPDDPKSSDIQFWLFRKGLWVDVTDLLCPQEIRNPGLGEENNKRIYHRLPRKGKDIEVFRSGEEDAFAILKREGDRFRLVNTSTR